jgi:hypothetical protein
MRCLRTGIFILAGISLIGCGSARLEASRTSTPSPIPDATMTNTSVPKPSETPEQKGYEFPESIDPAKRFIFYLHGKIIEDQGIPAISPEFGEYEYQAILETLSQHGFVVISEQRPNNTDGIAYARKITEQVNRLLNAGVPAKNITVVGASKGAGITIYVSNYVKNKEVNYVIMGICHPDEVEILIQAKISLSGNVLSIYDSVDNYAGSCQKLFSFSEGKGLGRFEEIVLHVGTGHGVLYQPLDEWVLPTVRWAEGVSP